MPENEPNSPDATPADTPQPDSAGPPVDGAPADGLEDLRDPVPGGEDQPQLPPRYRVAGSPASYEPVSLRHIDWASAFSFVNLFKGFRVAMHPSKLLLALAAVLFLYAGGRILDGLWLNAYQAVPGEIEQFDEWITRQDGTPAGFSRLRDEVRRENRTLFEGYRSGLANRKGVEPETLDLGDIKQDLIDRRRDQIEQANARFAAVRSDTSIRAQDRDRVLRDAEEVRDERISDAYAETAGQWRRLSRVNGRGLFMEFYEYEVDQFDGALRSVLELDLISGDGLIGRLYRFLYIGPLWGFSQHPLYFSLFFLWLLTIGAVFGGAISRIAAIQVARDEKISLRSSLRFSSGKFVSFLSAPLIPVLIIAVVGLATAAAAALGNIPWAGEIIVGAAFFLALLGGFIITLVLIGLVGGFSLMYPTVAVEGTDSFDAISRSFSYLYAKPWRLGLYAIIAIAYGAVTYLFVRLFLWLVLICTHTAAGLLIFRDSAGTDLLSAMWPAPPTFDRLSYDIDFINLPPTQDVAAALLAFWIYLIVALLAAFAISLYFSMSTIIYFLMRREVDATDFDDVYLDPQDEEFSGYADVPEADAPAPAGEKSK